MKKVFMVLFVFLAFVSCSTYSPQPNLPSTIKSIAVPIFINQTDKLNIEQYVTQKTIEEFLADGKVSILDEVKSDAVVKCAIYKYVLTPILFDVNQIPIQYRLRIYISLIFFDNKNQVQLWEEKSIWEETTYYVSNNLGMPVEDETIARNRVLDQIAKRIVARVIYGR
jgi:hypothetical protein